MRVLPLPTRPGGKAASRVSSSLEDDIEESLLAMHYIRRPLKLTSEYQTAEQQKHDNSV